MPNEVAKSDKVTLMRKTCSKWGIALSMALLITERITILYFKIEFGPLMGLSSYSHRVQKENQHKDQYV